MNELPAVWTVTLARSVEPRLVSRHSVTALMVIAGLISMALGFVLSGF